jgi:hypothetical protein
MSMVKSRQAWSRVDRCDSKRSFKTIGLDLHLSSSWCCQKGQECGAAALQHKQLSSHMSTSLASCVQSLETCSLFQPRLISVLPSSTLLRRLGSPFLAILCAAWWSWSPCLLKLYMDAVRRGGGRQRLGLEVEGPSGRPLVYNTLESLGKG